jgi:hypothetical protein
MNLRRRGMAFDDADAQQELKVHACQPAGAYLSISATRCGFVMNSAAAEVPRIVIPPTARTGFPML